MTLRSRSRGSAPRAPHALSFLDRLLSRSLGHAPRARRGLACLATTALALVLGCEGRSQPTDGTKTEPPKKRGPAVAVLDVTGGLPEQDKGGLFGLPSTKKSFDEALRVIADLRADDIKSTGVMVRLGSSIGAARGGELADALATLRAKKPVFCHADALGNLSLMVAAKGCSQIWIVPAGEVESIGIASQLVYMRRLLADELHLSIDILQVGKFKGAEEPLTRDGPSPEARASLTGVLTSLRTSWLDAITASRKVTPETIEDGPYTPQRAKELGLIDEVGYFDEATDTLKKTSGAVRERVVFGPGSEPEDGDLDELVRALAGESSATGPVALVRATGSIAMTSGTTLFGGRAGITEKDFDRTIDKLEKDDDVKAVVVRIDSPGGSALASDLMWHHLMKLRKKKPLIFSVGEMAASGGYYLASTGDYIFADPMSIVGSIGVVGGKIGIGDALERVGVHTETFPANTTKPGAAERAAYGSLMVRWDAPTRARVLEGMTNVYELFLSRVSEGRSTRGRTVTREKVAENAEGKIFSGRTGKDLGMVDELGGLEAALAKARQLAKLPESAHVAVISGKSGLFDGFDPTGAEERASASIGSARRAVAAAHRAELPVVSMIDIVDRLAPDLVPFVTSLAPLAEGEHSALAIPFAMTVR
jgi:protease IV